MADKPKMKYTSFTARNPRTGERYVAVTITDRAVKHTEQIAEALIRSGYTLGIQKSLLVGVLNSVADYVVDALREGSALLFDGRLSIRLDLAGRANDDGTLSAENEVRVNAIPLDESKRVSLADFSWTNTKESGDAPHIEFVMSDAAGAVRGELRRGQPVSVNGTHLALGGGGRAVFAWAGEGGEAASAEATVLSDGESLVKLDWPDALDDAAAGTEVSVTLTIPGGDGGLDRVSNVGKAKIVA